MNKLILMILVVIAVTLGCKEAEVVNSERPKQPIEALHTFYDGLIEGDKSKATSAATVTSESLEDFIAASIRVSQSMDKFAKLDADRFGVEGAMPVGFMAQSFKKKLADVPIKMIGEDRAEWPNNQNEPTILIKTDAGWKIDFSGPKYEKFLKITTDSLSRTAELFDEVFQSINDGKFQTREELRKEMARLKQEYGV